MKSFKFLIPLMLILLALTGALASMSTAHAHAGEDHGDDAAPVQAGTPLAPRTEARSDDVEMLAVYDNQELTIFLSHYKTNEPIPDAQVEIESGPHKALAQPIADGMFKAATPWLAEPGKHGLVLTIQGQDITELLESTLEIHDAEPATSNTNIARFAPAGLIASLGGALLVGVIAVGLRRRKKTMRSPS